MSEDKSIDAYRKKRDFARTPEPQPGSGPSRVPDRGRRPVFVVHRHEARRLHYDLRLEMEGVLRSWAVPKGFSYDIRDKHLAVRTEDHPLRYESFEGLIPKGEYGAGSLMIWDRGTYEVVKAVDGPSAVASGELKVVMRGRKLRGEWHLVKTNQGENTWLLFKSRDRYEGSPRDMAMGVDLARAEECELPARVRQLRVAESGRAPFSDPRWLFEAELVGRRVLVEKRGDDVRVRGLRRRLPAIEEALRAVRAENVLLDGILVVQDEDGRPSHELLEQALRRKGDEGLLLYAFDLLYVEDYDLRPMGCVDRKAALRTLLPASERLLFVDHVPGNGSSLAEVARAAGIQHVIAKRVDAPYAEKKAGEPAWLRIDTSLAESGAKADAVDSARRRRTRVKLTNPGKVFWPAEGYTKGDLVAYYEAAADLILPYLHDRPVHMNRHPDGIDGKSFYQRQAKEDTPAWVETVTIDSDSHGGKIAQLVCNDRDTLIWLANAGSIDLHPWLSRIDALDSPDWAILDLDPKDAPFADVIRIAREIGKLLFGIGLEPLLKTSGKTGLHVYVPLRRGYSYDQARMFCEGVARLVARDMKEIATVERQIGSRDGKVYIDYGQNRRGQTVVPPYSVRPVRGATVSTPLSWDELDSDLLPAHFTIQTVPQRWALLGDLFHPALANPQDLLPAIETLQGHLGGAS